MGDYTPNSPVKQKNSVLTLPVSKWRNLKVGVVGIGRMGRRHAINILHHVPRATLICACSPNEADLLWAAEYLLPRGVHVVPTFEEMIETPGLEAVIIASATPLHGSQSVAAMKKGIHVLCEKPLCKDYDELVSLVNTAETIRDASLMVAFVRRFDENYREAKQKLEENAIGTPIMIRSQGCELLDRSVFYKQYLRDSGGIFVDSIIHDIDLSLYMFGEDSQPRSVSASGVAACHPELEEMGDADNAVGICEFWNGKIAFFYNSRTSVHGYDNATEIFGTAGKLSINMTPRKNALEICDELGHVKTLAHPGWYERYAEAFVQEANEWVTAIILGRPMPIPLRSSLKSLKIAAALQESLRTGRRIGFDRDGERTTETLNVIC